jgi:hypothetical protein
MYAEHVKRAVIEQARAQEEVTESMQEPSVIRLVF